MTLFQNSMLPTLKKPAIAAFLPLLLGVLVSSPAQAQVDGQKPGMGASHFMATIKNSSASEQAQCLIFEPGKEYPTRYNGGNGTDCGSPAGPGNVVANRQGIWRFVHLQDDLYRITHVADSGAEQCLIFSQNGTAPHPSRYNWNDGPHCGFPDQASLLANRQAVYRLTNLEGNKYMITNSSSGSEQRLIFGSNGQASHPSRYNWAGGAYCGFPNKQALLDNKQAVWEIDLPNRLPEDRFRATIRNWAASGAAQCLIFGANGSATYPQRYNWADGPHCGFASANDLLANRQGVWQFVHLQGNQYLITNGAAGQEQCLTFGNNGSNAYPSRQSGAATPWCGFPDQASLLADRKMVFNLYNLADNRYLITSSASGTEQCLIFGSNGYATHPTRYNWAETGDYCGFPSLQAVLDNRQAVWEIAPIDANDANAPVHDLVARFAPELRFDRAAYGYPMSAQVFYDAWNAKKPSGADGFFLENTSKASLASGTLPTYYQYRKFGNQVRITYWWFYGYQHPCAGSSGSHQGDWERVTVMLNEAQTGVAAVKFYQHGDSYTRIAGPRDASCSGDPFSSRCVGPYGFESNGTHPVIYTGKTAHGSFHDSNSLGLGTYDACAYYGDYRNPASSEDHMQSWRKLVNLDATDEAWIAADRTATWLWGPDGISNHPTQHPPTGDEPACSGSATNSLGWPEGAGCYKSECLAGDDEDKGVCQKECRPGYTNWGLTCGKSLFDQYLRETYQYNFTLPQTDVGLMRRRNVDAEYNLP